MHHCCKIKNDEGSDKSESSDSDEDCIDSDNEEISGRDKQILKFMMSNEYADAEIDKLLE